MKKNIQKKRLEMFFRFAPLLIWIVVILGLGSGMGAANETSRFIRPLLEYFFPTASPETFALYHGYIRKFAHFAEYAILAVLACRAFAASPTSRRLPFVFPICLIILVAIIDETNQSFNPARSGSTYDVLLDFAGGILGILMFKLAGAK